MSAAPPRIAIATDTVAPYLHGGKETLYAELAERLAVTGDVTVYTMRWWQRGRRARVGRATHEAVCPALPLYRDGRRSIAQGLAYGLGCLRLARRRFDVIDADHMPYFPVMALWVVARLRRRPLVVTWHEVWSRAYWDAYLGGRAGRVGWLLERLAMRLPDHIIAGTPQTAARLRAHLGPAARVTVIPYGVDLDEVRAAAPAGDPRDVVGVGRLQPHKRWDVLIDAVARARDEGRPLTCLIVGQGPEEGSLRARIAARGVGDLVELRTDVDGRAAMLGYVKTARVFAAPSEREGFGIAVLEALAAGRAVVTSDAVDNLAADLVRRSQRGRVCPATEAAFAAGLAAACDAGLSRPDPEAWVDEYGWDAIAADTHALLTRVARGAP